MPPRAPDYLRAVWIEGNRRVVIETREGLAWMVNQAALTFHGWASRTRSLASPDWVIFDLDPGASTRFATVIDVALAIRKLLEMLELPSVVKTSGQKGLHVLVPIAPGRTAAQAHELAMRMSMLVARLYPADVSLDAQPEPRRGRLYLDHLQSFSGKSLVLPYALVQSMARRCRRRSRGRRSRLRSTHAPSRYATCARASMRVAILRTRSRKKGTTRIDSALERLKS